MITLNKQDTASIKINHILNANKDIDLDIYVFIPNDITLTTNIISETEFYHTAVTQKRFYYSSEMLLPLIHSRLAKRGYLSSSQYRVSLSLFAYQYVMALNSIIAEIDTLDDTINLEKFDELIELTTDILQRLRRSVPDEENQKRYYINVDNYLSWYTEQQFLALTTRILRKQNYSEIKEQLLNLCLKEQQYRDANNYNSQNVKDDLARLSNRMRLLRRLIEHPVVLRQKTITIGKNLDLVSKGVATTFVMIFVTLIILFSRDRLNEISASFVILLSIVYGLREVFKDELRDIIRKKFRQGKPKWLKRYIDPTSKKVVGKKLEWLNYKSLKTLSNEILDVRQKGRSQREERVLHYHAKTSMESADFLSGYEQTSETLSISLRPILRLMDRGSTKIYRLNDNDQVVKESVEKRYLLNIIIKENNHTDEPNFYRWKIILNRSQIISIEQVDLP